MYLFAGDKALNLLQSVSLRVSSGTDWGIVSSSERTQCNESLIDILFRCNSRVSATRAKYLQHCLPLLSWLASHTDVTAPGLGCVQCFVWWVKGVYELDLSLVWWKTVVSLIFLLAPGLQNADYRLKRWYGVESFCASSSHAYLAIGTPLQHKWRYSPRAKALFVDTYDKNVLRRLSKFVYEWYTTRQK